MMEYLETIHLRSVLLMWNVLTSLYQLMQHPIFEIIGETNLMILEMH